ncbi:MAG: ChaN family lipoprotein [Thermoanaerobaculaceae bacterium]|nr:ChaN family lipoprotein [Thermoanaerobaculaceae bacterium]
MRSLAGALVAVMLAASGYAQKAGPPGGWQTRVGADHALVGVIWDVQAGRVIDEPTLVARLARARFVLLGEKHDNPDHHRLQARVFSALLEAGRKPALAFEMLDGDDAPAVQAFLAGKPADAAGLGAAVGWDTKSWPAWAWYQQIADLAVRAGLPIVAANLPDRLARAAARQGLGAFPPEMVKSLGLGEPLAEPVRAAMAREIADSHCGFAPPGMVEPMILVQRARDAHMAAAVQKGATSDGAVLITGFGHARTDRAVPPHLLRGEAVVASLAFLEVQTGKESVPSYADDLDASTLPFDFVWMTPRVDDLDPCEKFKAKLEKLKAAQPAATPVPAP